MDGKVREYIQGLVPCRTRKKRWRQYSETMNRIFSTCPHANMDEVAKALAGKLGL